MVQQLFESVEEIREIISDTGDTPVLHDEALLVIFNACESDVNFACGGVNSIGAEFDGNEDVEIELVKSGSNLNTKSGDPGSITQIIFDYTDGFGNFGLLVIESFSERFISELSHHEISSYLLHDDNLYEFSALYGTVVTPNRFQYSYTGIAAESAYRPLDEIRDGRSLGFIIARPNAYIKAVAMGLTEVKRQAVVELATLRMSYDALQSMRDGTFSRVAKDYAKERKRILTWVQERLY